MANVGRGRGYTGRHHLRESRPGDEHSDTVRTLAELSPRSTVVTPTEPQKEKRDIETEKEDKDTATEEQINEDEAIKELLTIDEQFAPLISLLEQFSPGEDGILFNRKLRHFESTITNMCPDDARLQQAFETFRAAALRSGSTARKLAAVGASFTRHQRQRQLRATLLNVVMQGTHSKLHLLERSNPLFLINASNLMGDYFAEARLCNGDELHILAGPLLQYLRALLSSDDIRAHKSLATRLMQSGRELLTVIPRALDELSISIRLRMLAPPLGSAVWLLLAGDLCLNKFLPLPNALQRFYAAHLDLAPGEAFSEVSYGSWRRSPEEPLQPDEDKPVHSLSQLSLTHDDDSKPKMRPILGAGAGLLRQEQATVPQDPYDMWTPKNALSKRYDLNSWRQTEEEPVEEEPVFNPAVLPPNMNYPVTVPVPDFPLRYVYPEHYPKFLQQGDGVYIQSQYNSTVANSQGDCAPQEMRQPPHSERVNNELQQKSRRPIENWRKEKPDKIEKDENRNKPKNWTRRRSKDSLNDDKEKSSIDIRQRGGRRSTEEPETGRTPPRRHVADVPRNHKYWDHDDRCDKDYNS